MARSPSASCLPSITFVTDCSARSVSPRQPISAPRSRPLMSMVMGSVAERTVTCARTPMCFRSPSTRDRAVSAFPLGAAAPIAGAASWSMTLTSTTVSPAVSLMTRTSTLRRLSPSSINAASTASSSVRPRPSADFIRMPHELCSLFRPPGPAVLWSGLEAGRGPSCRTASTLGRHRLGRPPSTSSSLRKKIPPTDDEVLLNDTHAVADEPVEAKPGGNLQCEDSDHHRRQQHHGPLHLLRLQLLLGGVGRRRLLQHLRLDEGRDQRQREHRMVRRGVVQVGDEQERLDAMATLGEALEHVIERGEDGDLHDERQAADHPAERVDAVLLVELHRLLGDALLVLLEFLADLGDLRRQLALLGERLPLRQQLELRQRREREPDDDREHDDRDAVGADRAEERHRLEVDIEVEQERRQGLLNGNLPQVVDGFEYVEERAQVDVSISRSASKGCQGTGS